MPLVSSPSFVSLENAIQAADSCLPDANSNVTITLSLRISLNSALGPENFQARLYQLAQGVGSSWCRR